MSNHILDVLLAEPTVAGRAAADFVPVGGRPPRSNRTPLTSPDRGSIGHAARLTWLQTMLPLALRKLGADVFYSPGAEGMLRPSIPQVITVHDLIPLHGVDGGDRWAHYFRHLLPRILANSAAVICSSESTRQDIVDSYEHANIDAGLLHVVSLGVDHTTFRPTTDSRVKSRYGLERFVLASGQPKRYKNVERTIAAFEQLDTNAHLVLVGTPPGAASGTVRLRAETSPASGRIRVLPYLELDDLVGLYSDAEAFFCLSEREGFGLPLLEAMACGTPVLAANATSLPEVGSDAVLYVDPFDVADIAAGMAKILDDDTLRDDLRGRGIRRAKEFSWERTAEQVATIITSALT